jgi:hypothetical protein
MNKRFVLAYKRSAGRLLEKWEFESYVDAFAKRAELDLRYRTDQDVEIALLGADSLDELKKTHSRYFRSLSDMVTG